MVRKERLSWIQIFNCHNQSVSQMTKVTNLSLSLPLSLSLSFCWSGHVPSSFWKNVSKGTSLLDHSLKKFSTCICAWHCLYLCLFVFVIVFVIVFFWSCHVSSSLWSNVSRSQVSRFTLSSVVLWRLWLLVVTERPRDRQTRCPIELFWTAKNTTGKPASGVKGEF